MNPQLKILGIIIILFFGLVFNVQSQNSPCTAAAGEIGITTDCSGQLTTSGSWTTPGSGIVNPATISACLPAATSPSHNYWISYTIPSRIIQMRITFEGRSNGNASVRLQDIAVQMYSSASCAGPFTLINCFNDVGNVIDQTINVTPGETYYFRVFDGDGVSSASSEFNYCFQLIHEGDNACIAIPITSFPYSYTLNTSNNGITNELTGGCNGNSFATIGAANDLFFSVNMLADSYVSLRLTGTNAANWTEISIIETSDCANGPYLCMPNGAWEGGLQATAPDSTNSPCRTVYFANAGTYYIRVDSDVNEGPFTLNADSYTPINGDACINAMALSPSSPVTFNSTNHTNTIGSDDPTPPGLFCAGTVENTNWFYFQSDGSGSTVSVTVSNVTCNSGYYTFIPGPPGPGGYAFYSAQGQFGIVTSSTGTCGGIYTAAAACQTVVPGFTYTVNLPNASVTDYFMIWDGNGGAECKYSIEVTNINPLPIELIHFDAILNDDRVDVLWTTASEINNDYFVVERSANKTDFEQLTIIDGAGNSNTEIEYKTIDFHPLNGKSYYRLKQVDFNGIYTYSEIVEVNNTKQTDNSFTVIPNPVTDNSIYISLNTKINKSANLIIVDSHGSEVLSMLVFDSANPIKITHQLSNGLYMIKYISDEFIQSQKLIISKN
ncbi:MAG: T9SS type A sorting domain-containing protein [Bacteroidia bacterium]|nr:T9SS type A sorting domain-containing protein [Bacteroidia bacterium]NNC84864.1 T9SS type A sorting domain-containing protein [Bacteroidia bacterium]